MGYWKAKVVPAFHKLIGKDAKKKAGAAEACKSFDDSKESLNKEFEEKRAELEPKVLEIYQACSAEIKGLIKEPKPSALKKHKNDVQKLLTNLVNIEFPGAKAVGEATTNYGISYVSGPTIFILEKVSSFVVVVEEKPKDKEEEEAPAAATAAEETSGTAEREIAVEEQPKEDAPAAETPAEGAKDQGADQTAAEPPAAAPSKVEESPAEQPPKP